MCRARCAAQHSAAAYRALFQVITRGVLAEPRTDRDLDYIELVLTIIRNLLHVADPKVCDIASIWCSPRRAWQDRDGPSLHELTLEAMHDSGLFDVIITMTNNLDEYDGFALLLLEIVAQIFRDCSPSSLLEAKARRNCVLAPPSHGRAAGGNRRESAGPQARRRS